MAEFPADLIVPQSGVIKKHLDLFFPPGKEPITEAPKQFVYASMVSTLSTIISKSAWIPWFGSNLYPNAYILLIGESTLTRKTTCVKLCQGYLTDMCISDPSIDEFIFPSTGSPEGIFEELSTNPQGTFIFSEFSTLTDLLEKKYAADLKAFLTDLFDCGLPKVKKLSNKKKITVQNYCINLFAGTAIDWFEQASKQKDFTSGWYTRFLFVWGEDTGVCIPFPNSLNVPLRMSIITDLINIHKMRPGEVRLTDEAKVKYREWYIKRRTMLNAETKTMDVRLFDYILKISIINALSDQRDKISLEDMDKALAFINWLTNNNRHLMFEHISFSQWDAEIKKIVKIFKRIGPCTRRELMRRTSLIPKQIDVCISTLLQRGDIEEVPVETTLKGGRPTVIYKLK